MDISNKLKGLRNSKKMSMEDLSEAFMKLYGVTLSKSMISRYENGLTEPSLSIACLYSQYFNVTLDYLTKDDDYKPDAIAAHFEGDEVTEEELQSIRNAPHYIVCDSNTGEQRHGLGLLIVKQIAQAHGGRVVLDHSPQGGFLAKILFPKDWEAT